MDQQSNDNFFADNLIRRKYYLNLMRPWFESERRLTSHAPLILEPKPIELSVAMGILIFQYAMKKEPPTSRVGSMFDQKLQCGSTHCTSITYEMLLHNAVLQVLYRCASALGNDLATIIDVAIDVLLQLTKSLLVAMPHVSRQGLAAPGSLLLCIDAKNFGLFVSQCFNYNECARVFLLSLANKMVNLSASALRHAQGLLNVVEIDPDKPETVAEYWSGILHYMSILCADADMMTSVPITCKRRREAASTRRRVKEERTAMLKRPPPLHWTDADILAFGTKRR